MAKAKSFGKSCQEHFFQLLKQVRRTAHAGPGAVAVISGITAEGNFVGGMTMDAVLAEAGKLFLDCGLVYAWADDVAIEFESPAGKTLAPLTTGLKALPEAPGLLTNLFVVQVQGEKDLTQAPVPSKLARTLLTSQRLRSQLPVVRYYARRPVYDEDFRLCGPGWHEGPGILVHGEDVDPIPPRPVPAEFKAAIDRLPRLLGKLFSEFCFASDADLTNAVAMLLTGLLANHFVEGGKPMGFVEANQRNVGKTLLVEATGRILDGAAPARLKLCADDEELEKKVGAQLRKSESSILLFDNVRGRVDSPCIETNLTSPTVTVRLLGQSAMISRPNTYLWFLTCNGMQGTEDLIARGVPIRLRHEGDPRRRDFALDPREFADEHRVEILGELAGMVEAWKLAGMPRAAVKHRFRHWAEVIGGILQVAGLDQFLANVEEAEAEMDEGVQALTALAEYVVGKGHSKLFTRASGAEQKDLGGSGKDWVPVFTQVGVFRRELESGNNKSATTIIGRFLSAKIGRTVRITTAQDGCSSSMATLKKVSGRSGTTLYFFVVEDEQPAEREGVKEHAAENAPITTATTTTTAEEIRPTPAGEPPVSDGPPPALQEPDVPSDSGNDLTWF